MISLLKQKKDERCAKKSLCSSQIGESCFLLLNNAIILCVARKIIFVQLIQTNCYETHFLQVCHIEALSFQEEMWQPHICYMQKGKREKSNKN